MGFTGLLVGKVGKRESNVLLLVRRSPSSIGLYRRWDSSHVSGLEAVEKQCSPIASFRAESPTCSQATVLSGLGALMYSLATRRLPKLREGDRGLEGRLGRRPLEPLAKSCPNGKHPSVSEKAGGLVPAPFSNAEASAAFERRLRSVTPSVVQDLHARFSIHFFASFETCSYCVHAQKTHKPSLGTVDALGALNAKSRI